MAKHPFTDLQKFARLADELCRVAQPLIEAAQQHERLFRDAAGVDLGLSKFEEIRNSIQVSDNTLKSMSDAFGVTTKFTLPEIPAGFTESLDLASKFKFPEVPQQLLAEISSTSNIASQFAMPDISRHALEAFGGSVNFRFPEIPAHLLDEFRSAASLAIPEDVLRSFDLGDARFQDVFKHLDSVHIGSDILERLNGVSTLHSSLLDQLPNVERWAAVLENRDLGESIGRFVSKARAEAPPERHDIQAFAVTADAIVDAARTPEERVAAQHIAYFLLAYVATKILDKAWDKIDPFEWLMVFMMAFSSATPLPPVPAAPLAVTAPALPVPAPNRSLDGWQIQGVPDILRRAGPTATKRTLEFFAAQIRNANTRQAYMRAVIKFFNWCDDRSLELSDITPFVVAAYIQEIQHDFSSPTVKQHLAAIRMLFEYLVVGQVIPMNPAASVRGPRHVVKRGKTPVLTADQARLLLDSIDTSTVAGLRDRALIGVMVYSFARVSATVGMRIEDYFPTGKHWWFGLHEKGGKRHEVPAHHNAEKYVNEYLEAAGIADDKKGPLFRTFGRNRQLTPNRMNRADVLRMIYRRAAGAGLDVHTCCHTFRATGITAYLENGGTIEKAQQIAAHESPRTTKLYDRTNDELTLDEIERIVI